MTRRESGDVPRRRHRRRVWRSIVVGLVVLALLPTVSLGQALLSPGTDPVTVKAAEWARGHHLGFLITFAEEISYRLKPPASGGTPDPSLLGPARPAGDGRDRLTRHGRRPAQAAVADLKPLVQPALPGEGVLRTKVTDGQTPAVQLAYLRPDSRHTSYLAAVMIVNQHVVRFVQHPGYDEPGHLNWWQQPDSLTSTQQRRLAVTFNNGFKISDAQGGYFADGHTVGTLTSGAASLVVMRNGTMDIGSWGRELRMSGDIVSVRQNLQLLIDHGRVAANIQADAQKTWGKTIAGVDYIWRSGVGIDARGNIISVVGPALSAPTLAAVLLRAGAVRAMELDINPWWVSAMWYGTTSGQQPQPHKVLPFRRPADRYLQPSSRDFVAGYLR